MHKKKALITGITGQDGAYLAPLLIEKGYEVHGIRRRASTDNTERLAPILRHTDLHLHYGDMCDGSSLMRIIGEVKPDEIYNLAAQSHVQISFEAPEYTVDSIGVGTLRLLEAVRLLGIGQKTRIFQASTSELFGNAPAPQNEQTPLVPRSPYAAAKLYAYSISLNYREAYGMHISNGIMFNHESPLRGENFVTRKIAKAVAAIKAGKQECLYLGNLDAKRDWGHARDFMLGAWAMLQQDRPDDYVLATGQSYNVRDFANAAFGYAGTQLTWQGSGVNECAIDENGRVLVRVDPAFFRPTEVDYLQGEYTKAKRVLGWAPKTSFDALVAEMVDAELQA